MEISVTKRKSGNIYFIHMSKSEAIETIRSLFEQLLRGAPNAGRVEMLTDKNEYFSIAVDGG